MIRVNGLASVASGNTHSSNDQRTFDMRCDHNSSFKMDVGRHGGFPFFSLSAVVTLIINWAGIMSKAPTKGGIKKSALQAMPPVVVSTSELKKWGGIWNGTSGSVNKSGATTVKKSFRFDKKQGMDFGYTFDGAFAAALAVMLGGISVLRRNSDDLIPPQGNIVEVGRTRIVGGIRPQNYDAAYRPDGPRIVFDSKTLNDKDSIKKNWQNMVNDLATEAATVHTRFPYCIVSFIVALPEPAVMPSQRRDIVRTLERLGSRKDELDQHHLAEAISLVLWDPATGKIDPSIPDVGSNLRLDTMHDRIYPHYVDRYKNLPPHDI